MRAFASSQRLASFGGKAGLFRKYAVYLTIPVCLAVLAGGTGAAFFAQLGLRRQFVSLQAATALLAADKIENFVAGVQRQVAWLVQLPAYRDVAAMREDCDRLLGQVPAISDVRLVDAAGREQIFVSRFALDRLGSGVDLSATDEVSAIRAGKNYFGSVFFVKGTEPYMSVAVPRPFGGGGAIVDMNLTAIWDVVTAIRVGRSGIAYVVDRAGTLVAHPDISLVLRKTSFVSVPQVAKAVSMFGDPAGESSPSAISGADPQGHATVSTAVRVNPLNWIVFVEQRRSEAYAPVYSIIVITAALMCGGLLLALVVSFQFAGRMVGPIRALRDGATRIGAGDLAQRITVDTGDELEELARQFNTMGARLQDSYATLERKVDERTQQLATANLAKSRFLAAASHDLRQPLHALGLFAAQLRAAGDVKERRHIVARIASAVDAMNQLFNALLDISKLDAGAVAPGLSSFPANDILRRVEAVFADPAREKGLDLRIVYGGAWVHSDPILLERILLNLVSNAIRYTARGRVLVGYRRRAGAVRLEVWDTGPGIPEEQIPTIFGEFVQLGDAGRRAGLGLGLAIVEQLCRLLEHEIDVRSKVGKGSCFAVVLPSAEPVARLTAPQVPPPLPVATVKNRLVAVVDDDPLVLDGMRGLLKSWGCRVVTARSAGGVVEALAAQNAVPDLLISDYHLEPGVSGIDVIERLRDRFNARFPAFLVSGDIGSERLNDVKSRGYRLLHKPVSPMALRAIVIQYLMTPPRSDPATVAAEPAPP